MAKTKVNMHQGMLSAGRKPVVKVKAFTFFPS